MKLLVIASYILLYHMHMQVVLLRPRAVVIAHSPVSAIASPGDPLSLAKSCLMKKQMS